MRISLVAFFAATLVAGSALAQQPGRPGEGQGLGPGQGQPPPRVKALEPPLPPSTTCDPSFGGKYSNELRRLEIPQDRGQYGPCHDYGAWTGNEYQGHTDLPNGYWVYSFPHWILAV